MTNKQIIRDFYGKIIGSIETLANGDKIVRNFYGRVLGRYDKKHDLTRDFYGRVIARGDQSGALLSIKSR